MGIRWKSGDAWLARRRIVGAAECPIRWTAYPARPRAHSAGLSGTSRRRAGAIGVSTQRARTVYFEQRTNRFAFHKRTASQEVAMGVFDKAKDFIHSEEVEEKSDAVLDKAEDLATEKLGADKADTIAKVRNTIDDKIGNESNS